MATPSVPTHSWTIGTLLTWTAQYFAEQGLPTPRLDAEVLLAHALGVRRIDLYVRFHEPAEVSLRERFRDLVRRRVAGCPVAYLVGKKEFFSLEFRVTPDVMIPRPETEMLVLAALERAAAFAAPRILDLGTGCGNIAIALAKHLSTATLVASDKSPAAVHVARDNAARLGVLDRIAFRTGDLFEVVQAGEQFTLIVSNPPYIARHELAGLDPGVRDYEPHLALDGGLDGYEVVRRIVAQAPNFLEPGGYLVLEIAAPQADTVRHLVERLACFERVEIIADAAHGPRALCARAVATSDASRPDAALAPA
ncbi:MAG: peptide chain release factor N(5)-glutamine methyltransferase [Gemmataceae bacterium]